MILYVNRRSWYRLLDTDNQARDEKCENNLPLILLDSFFSKRLQERL
jgi:hypothetical protein